MTARPFTSLALVLLIAFSLTSCGQRKPPGAAPEPVRQAILDEVRQYYTDFSARDWDAFASHFWPGATLSTIWQPPGEEVPRVVVTTLEDFVEQAPLGPGSREIFEERLLDAEVLIDGNLAHVWASYEARFGDPGDITSWRGIDAFTLMNHEGEWKIVSLSYTNTD